MIIYLSSVLFMSLVTYMLYYHDKRNSIKGKWRIKEKTLLLMSVFLGSLGGLIAMYQFRHKTKHFSFIAVNWIFLILHIIIGYFIHQQFPLSL